MQAKLKEQIFAHGLWSAHRRPVCFSPGQCRFPTRCLGATPAQPMLVQSSARLSGLQPRCLTSRGAVEVLHGGPAALLKLFSRRALPAGQARKHASMTCSRTALDGNAHSRERRSLARLPGCVVLPQTRPAVSRPRLLKADRG